MFESNRKDILSSKIEYATISLISKGMRVLIIGAGKAALIKAKTLLKKSCSVTVISKEVLEEFNELSQNENLVIIKDEYKNSYIKDKHLIIIAINDDEKLKEIIEDCEKLSKLYLNCTDFKKGNFIMPMSGETENINYSIHTKGGSPRISKYLNKVIKDNLMEYDDFVGYAVELRKKAKESQFKKEILEFIASEDFKYMFSKDKADLVLKMFYGGKSFEYKIGNKEE